MSDSETTWFVLYVRTGSEDRIVREISARVDTNFYKIFIPTIVLPLSGRDKSGNRRVKTERCFPGYIFFQVPAAPNVVETFNVEVARKTASIDGIYYFLHYGLDKGDIAMHAAEKQVLQNLLSDDFRLEPSIGFKEGDTVRIAKGALMGFESKIIRVNKHKRTAVINVNILGQLTEMTVMLEIVEKA